MQERPVALRSAWPTGRASTTPVFFLFLLGGYQHFRREFRKFFRRRLRQRPAKLEDFLPHAIRERLMLQGLKISSGKAGRVIAEHEKTGLEVLCERAEATGEFAVKWPSRRFAPGGVHDFREPMVKPLNDDRRQRIPAAEASDQFV